MDGERTDDDVVDAWTTVMQGFTSTQHRLIQDIDAHSVLGASGFEVLLRLRRAEGRMPMNRLATHMTMTSGGFTKLADRMVEAGYLLRIPSDDDRRVTYIELTPQGRDVADAAISDHVRSLREHVLSTLTLQQLEDLAAIMRLLRDANSA